MLLLVVTYLTSVASRVEDNAFFLTENVQNLVIVLSLVKCTDELMKKKDDKVLILKCIQNV